MAKDGNNFISRYSLIVVVIALCGIGIISRAIYTMYVKDDYWLEVAEHFRSDSLTVEPFRGNILSDDGELLASSLPEYTLYIDFKAGGFQDTTFQKYVDTMATDLHRIFPDKSKRHFKELLKNGYRNRNKRRNLRLYPERVSYAKYQELMSCPYFSLGPNRSGFYGAKIDNRQRPFGSIALRTIGDVSKDSKVGAKYGVELAFDSVLRGKSDRWCDIGNYSEIEHEEVCCNSLDVKCDENRCTYSCHDTVVGSGWHSHSEHDAAEHRKKKGYHDDSV